jgi:hypothetical protein
MQTMDELDMKRRELSRWIVDIELLKWDAVYQIVVKQPQHTIEQWIKQEWILAFQRSHLVAVPQGVGIMCCLSEFHTLYPHLGSHVLSVGKDWLDLPLWLQYRRDFAKQLSDPKLYAQKQKQFATAVRKILFAFPKPLFLLILQYEDAPV